MEDLTKKKREMKGERDKQFQITMHGLLILLLITFMINFSECVYIHACATVCVTEWNSQDTCGSCFSIHSMGPGD